MAENSGLIDPADMATHAESAARFLRALANPHRLQVLCVLEDREMSVSELNASIPLSQSALSQQLSKLRALKLVSTRRDGRTIFYSVTSDKVCRVLETLYDIYCAPRKAGQNSEAAAV